VPSPAPFKTSFYHTNWYRKDRALQDEEYLYNQDLIRWQNYIITKAMERVANLYPANEGPQDMDGYDIEIANRVLEAAGKAFPKNIRPIELKHAISPEPSDEALMTAIDALLIEELVTGPHMRTGYRNELRDVVHIQITNEGRKHLKALSSPSEAQLPGVVFHGDQNINYGHAGVIGRNGQGVVSINERWNEIKDQTDLNVLATELEKLRVECPSNLSAFESVITITKNEMIKGSLHEKRIIVVDIFSWPNYREAPRIRKNGLG
jgi:hypothetical protein